MEYKIRQNAQKFSILYNSESILEKYGVANTVVKRYNLNINRAPQKLHHLKQQNILEMIERMCYYYCKQMFEQMF